MANKEPIQTSDAPAAIGPYSQAIKSGPFVFLSGQIPLDPEFMELVGPGIEEQTQQVFKNLSAVANAAGGSLNDIVKLTIYLTDLGLFATVNSIMAEYFAATKKDKQQQVSMPVTYVLISTEQKHCPQIKKLLSYPDCPFQSEKFHWGRKRAQCFNQ